MEDFKDFTREESKDYQVFLEKIYEPIGINVFELCNQNNSPCDNCTNNPKNGGSGICHCVLGTPVIY